MKFKECEEWYDGYKIGKISVCNPNSLVEAMMRRECAIHLGYLNYDKNTKVHECVIEKISEIEEKTASCQDRSKRSFLVLPRSFCRFSFGSPQQLFSRILAKKRDFSIFSEAEKGN